MIDKSEKFNWLVRTGFFARAVLYSVLGLVALTSAGTIQQGTNGIFRAIQEFPAGAAILWLMVFGLVGYAFFRMASALFDIEHNGSDVAGKVTRVGHAGSALGHLALAYSAFRFATSHDPASADNAREAASGLLSIVFGNVVIGLLGAAFILAAAFQAKKGLTGEFMHRISAQAPAATRWLGGAGYLARSVVFAIIGWSLFNAGFLSGRAEQIKTIGDAVASLSGTGIWFTLVSLGLLLFGLFSFLLARHRIIPRFGAKGFRPVFRA